MIVLEEVLLRPFEAKDVESLYVFRNDWEVIQHLGGYSAGYSRANLQEWIQRHSGRNDEILWAIAEQQRSLHRPCRSVRDRSSYPEG